MRPIRLLPILALVCFFAVGTKAQQQFTVIATLLDPATNAPSESLRADEVRLTEDGVALKVLKVAAVDRTVKAQLLIDNGIGIGSNLSQLRSGLRGLVEKLPPDVETSIYTTAPQGRLLQRATKNREELLKAVDRLTPDSSPGRFTESLTEAGERATKEKDAFTVIIMAGTTSGDSALPEGAPKRLIASIANRPLVVHVLLYAGERAAFGGDAQIQIGETVTKMTGGRYEHINNMNRYVTLLPEFADSVVKQMTAGKRQFRIAAQRADGKTGPMGKMSLAAGARIITSVRVE
jgi:hypothetical protein